MFLELLNFKKLKKFTPHIKIRRKSQQKLNNSLISHFEATVGAVIKGR